MITFYEIESQATVNGHKWTGWQYLTVDLHPVNYVEVLGAYGGRMTVPQPTRPIFQPGGPFPGDHRVPNNVVIEAKGKKYEYIVARAGSKFIVMR